LVCTGLVFLIERCKEGIAILLDQLRLVGLRVEAHDYLLHLLLRKLDIRIDVLNLLPSFKFALRVWNGGKAVDASLHRFVRLIISQNLLHEAELWHLLDRGLTTKSLEKISLLTNGQVHNNCLLCILQKCLSSLKPLNHHLTLILSLEELINIFNDLLLDILRSRWLGSDLK